MKLRGPPVTRQSSLLWFVRRRRSVRARKHWVACNAREGLCQWQVDQRPETRTRFQAVVSFEEEFDSAGITTMGARPTFRAVWSDANASPQCSSRYTPVAVSAPRALSHAFAPVPARSRARLPPVSRIPVNPREPRNTSTHPFNTLKPPFLNLGSGVRFPSGTPFFRRKNQTIQMFARIDEMVGAARRRGRWAPDAAPRPSDAITSCRRGRRARRLRRPTRPS